MQNIDFICTRRDTKSFSSSVDVFLNIFQSIFVIVSAFSGFQSIMNMMVTNVS